MGPPCPTEMVLDLFEHKNQTLFRKNLVTLNHRADAFFKDTPMNKNEDFSLICFVRF